MHSATKAWTAQPPQVEHRNDGSVLISPPPPAAADQMPLLAFPFGLESEAARRLIREKIVRVARIGRRLYATREEIAGLVARLSAAPESAKSTGLADLAAAEKKAGRK